MGKVRRVGVAMVTCIDSCSKDFQHFIKNNLQQRQEPHGSHDNAVINKQCYIVHNYRNELANSFVNNTTISFMRGIWCLYSLLDTSLSRALALPACKVGNIEGLHGALRLPLVI